MTIKGNDRLILDFEPWQVSCNLKTLRKQSPDETTAKPFDYYDWDAMEPIVKNGSAGLGAGIMGRYDAYYWWQFYYWWVRMRGFMTFEFDSPACAIALGVGMYIKMRWMSSQIYEGINVKFYRNTWETLTTSDWDNLGELVRTEAMPESECFFYISISAAEVAAGKAQRVVTTDKEENNAPPCDGDAGCKTYERVEIFYDATEPYTNKTGWIGFSDTF